MTGLGKACAAVVLTLEFGDVAVGGDADEVGLALDLGHVAGVAGVADRAVEALFELLRDRVGGGGAFLADVGVPGQRVGELGCGDRGETVACHPQTIRHSAINRAQL